MCSFATRFSGTVGTISRGVWFTGDTTRRSGVSVTTTVAVCGGGIPRSWVLLQFLEFPVSGVAVVVGSTATAESTGLQPPLMGRLSLQALQPVEMGVWAQELWWFLESGVSGTTANTPAILPLPQGPVHQPSDTQMCGSQAYWCSEPEVLCWAMDVLLDATYRGETKGMAYASTMMLMSLLGTLLTDTICQIVWEHCLTIIFILKTRTKNLLLHKS